MAKGNLILGMGRGSIGDVTLYRANGAQVSRARNRAPKNPKTRQQTAQRIIMRTAVRAYSVLKELCDHSFQNYAYGAENMNRFNSVNANFLRQQAIDYAADPTKYSGDYYDYALPKIGYNALIVSEGSLIAPTVTIPDADDGAAALGTGAPASLSYDDVISFLGLQRGDQITVLQIDDVCNFTYGRFILAPSDGDYTKLVTNAAVANEANVGNVNFAIDGGSLFVDVAEAGDGMGACAVIISRLGSDGKWLRSTSRFALARDVVGNSLEEVMTGTATKLPQGSEWYLNQAESVAAEGESQNP